MYEYHSYILIIIDIYFFNANYFNLKIIFNFKFYYKYKYIKIYKFIHILNDKECIEYYLSSII